MNNKKLIILILGLVCIGFPVFAAMPTAANLALGDYKVFDSPLISGLAYFQSISMSFMRIARILAVGIGFISIVWISFRLIVGTIEVKKALFDIGTKFLLFTIIMMLSL